MRPFTRGNCSGQLRNQWLAVASFGTSGLQWPASEPVACSGPLAQLVAEIWSYRHSCWGIVSNESFHTLPLIDATFHHCASVVLKRMYVLLLDEGGDVEEGKDLLQEPPCTVTNVQEKDEDSAPAEKETTTKRPTLASIKLTNPFRKSKVGHSLVRDPRWSGFEFGARAGAPKSPTPGTMLPIVPSQGGPACGNHLVKLVTVSIQNKRSDQSLYPNELPSCNDPSVDHGDGVVPTGDETTQPDESHQGGGKRLLNAIKLPLVSVLPRKLKPKDKSETAPGAAGLASMETLDDSGAAEAEPDKGEDGMESVKLDADNDKCDLEKGGDTTDTSKMASWRARLGLLSKFRLLVAVVVIFIILLIIIIAVAASGPRHRDHTSAPVMDGRYVEAVTSCGMVQGLLENGAFSFRGIPYALPPVHERRFLPARPVDQLDKCWNGTFLAHNASTPCWQIYRDGSVSGAEDCLTLDVHTPFVRYENPLPVVVLLGADSLSGGSPGPMRATAKLARSKEVVFVTVNFRLGPLGFLATEYLTRSVKPQTSGNYGLSDILTALKWIKLNIENFNGDKNAVTVFGHRAGGTLVTALTSSKMAKGLFSRAWVSSGSGVFPGKDLAEEQMDNGEYVRSLGCGDADCLQRLDVKELLNKVPGHWRYPAADLPSSGLPSPHRWLVLDGVILRQHLSDVWEKDEGLPIKLVMGMYSLMSGRRTRACPSNLSWKDEGLLIKLVMGASSHSDVPDNLKTSWNDDSGAQVERYVRDSLLGSHGLADEVFRRYNRSYSGLVSLISDIRTVCPLLTLSRSRPGVPFYVVTHPRSEDGLAGVAADVEAIDVEAILGTYEPRDVEQKRFVTAMQEIFYRFVHLGELRREEAEKKSNQNRVLLIGQDANPSRDYPNCDYWIAHDIVPRYARID
uniref:Carboxylesterase type B domain-containing protein n=1 Tax=Timema genevievae TaxID=629358 RepID=A0A7R9K1R7_TIMGE|nr:unnamed protein product [Timema genevievae]